MVKELKSSSKPFHSLGKIMKIILIVLLVIFIMHLMFRQIVKRYRFLSSQVESLQKEMNYLEKENRELRESLEAENREELFEKEARMSLGLKKEGEKTVVLKPITTTTTLTAISEQPDQNSKLIKWFEKIKNF